MCELRQRRLSQCSEQMFYTYTHFRPYYFFVLFVHLCLVVVVVVVVVLCVYFVFCFVFVCLFVCCCCCFVPPALSSFSPVCGHVTNSSFYLLFFCIDIKELAFSKHVLSKMLKRLQ